MASLNSIPTGLTSKKSIIHGFISLRPIQRGLNSLKCIAPGLITLLLLAIAAVPSSKSALAQSSDVALGGYVQVLPVYLSATDSDGETESWWDFRLQNRVNLRWFASENLSFTGELRSRVFAGDLVRDVPDYRRLVADNGGLTDLSVTLPDEGDWFATINPDRLFAEYSTSEWNIRVGRQRVNWGINLLTNPNDLFNIYSLYEFDYPERPGADAVRIQHFLDWASRLELAWSPGRTWDESVVALMYAFNRNAYDIQLIAGAYRSGFSVGGGWAGNLGESGFKGELMFHAWQSDTPHSTNFVASVSIDHMIAGQFFIVSEITYNLRGGGQGFNLLENRLRADNPTLSRFQFTNMVQVTLSPVLSATLTGLIYPDEQALFLSPALTASVLSDLDLTVLTQWFTGWGDGDLSQTAAITSASVKWSF